MQGYTQLYRAKRSYTELYKAKQSYTQLYRAIHSCTGLYRVIHSYTELYTDKKSPAQFYRPSHCLQMQAETAWTLKSSFVIVMLIEHRPPLTLYQKLLMIFSFILKQSIHLNSDAELQIYPKNGKRIHFKVVYLDNLHTNTCNFAQKYY